MAAFALITAESVPILIRADRRLPEAVITNVLPEAATLEATNVLVADSPEDNILCHSRKETNS